MAKDFKNVILSVTLLTILVFSAGCSKSIVRDAGFLEGIVSIGPICPVEKDPPDPGCLPTAETYNAYPVAVWTSDGKRKITGITPALDGSYTTELQPGDYLIILENGGNNIGSCNLPVQVNITPGQITTLNIDIDTGIR